MGLQEEIELACDKAEEFEDWLQVTGNFMLCVSKKKGEQKKYRIYDRCAGLTAWIADFCTKGHAEDYIKWQLDCDPRL